MRIWCAAYAAFALVVLWFSYFHPMAYGSGINRVLVDPAIGGRYRIVSVSGQAARAGFKPGDITRDDLLPILDRWRLHFGAHRGRTLTYAVQRGGGIAFLRVAADVARPAPFGPSGVLTLLVGTLSLLLCGYVGYRRPGIAALALTTYAGGILNPNFDELGLSKAPDLLFIGLGVPVMTLFNLFPNVALASFVVRFPKAPTGRLSRLPVIIDGICIGAFAIDLLQQVFLHSTYFTYTYAQNYLGAATALVLALAVLSYLRSGRADRARARVVLAAVTVSSAIYTASIVDYHLNLSLTILQYGSIAAIAVTTVSLAYAILKHHVFDIAFVLNQAAVLAGTSAVVLLAFTILESVTERSLKDLTRTENIVADVIFACCVVALIRPLHLHVDALIDRHLFRDRHEAEMALLGLSERSRFYTDLAKLEQDTRSVLSSALDTEGVEIYQQSDIDAGDAAVRDMSARGVPVDLRRYDTALYGYRAYPMLLAGHIIGILTVGPRQSGEAMPPDIDKALCQVAQSFGACMTALHADAAQTIFAT